MTHYCRKQVTHRLRLQSKINSLKMFQFNYNGDYNPIPKNVTLFVIFCVLPPIGVSFYAFETNNDKSTEKSHFS